MPDTDTYTDTIPWSNALMRATEGYQSIIHAAMSTYWSESMGGGMIEHVKQIWHTLIQPFLPIRDSTMNASRGEACKAMRDPSSFCKREWERVRVRGSLSIIVTPSLLCCLSTSSTCMQLLREKKDWEYHILSSEKNKPWICKHVWDQ